MGYSSYFGPLGRLLVVFSPIGGQSPRLPVGSLCFALSLGASRSFKSDHRNMENKLASPDLRELAWGTSRGGLAVCALDSFSWKDALSKSGATGWKVDSG